MAVPAIFARLMLQGGILAGGYQPELSRPWILRYTIGILHNKSLPSTKTSLWGS